MSINYLLPVIAITFNCIIPQSLNAQSLQSQALADSLINELPKTKSDTNKVKLLQRITKVLATVNPGVAMDYADKCLRLAQHAKWSKGVGLAYVAMARVYWEQSDYAAGLQNSRNAYEVFKINGDTEGMADALMQVANNYDGSGYYTKAIENNFAALRLWEALKNKQRISSAYNNMGSAYYRINNFPKALESYKMSLEIDKNQDKHNVASTLDNIACVYTDIGKYDSADDYNLRAIKLFEEIDHQPELSITYYNRANLLLSQHNAKLAYEFYTRSIEINKRLDLKHSLALDYVGVGKLYLSLAKDSTSEYILLPLFNTSKSSLLKKAQYYFKEALTLSEQLGDIFGMMTCTSMLSETEELRDNNVNALAYHKAYVLYKDSIFNDENKRKIAALENEHLAETKDKEIQLLSKDKALQASEIKRQTLIKDIIIIAVVTAAIFTFFFIRSFNRRRKIVFDKQVLQTEMKALRAQMNPHFIFNSLHSINKYVMENDKNNASEYLAKFAKLMRLVLENSREQEVPLENDLAALELYMQLESLRFENRFQYSIEIDPGIDKENTLIPPLMLQPFAENAIVHGIKDKEGGFIKINIRAENNMIRCVVEDNGTGREPLPVTGQGSDKNRKSLGIKILQERLNIINQLKKAKAAIHIFDLKDAENKPGGLRIELLLPLQKAF